MAELVQRFSVPYEYRVCFTRNVFSPDNRVLLDLLGAAGPGVHRCLVVLDSGVVAGRSDLPERIRRYAAAHADHLALAAPPLIVEGGEGCKRRRQPLRRLLAAVASAGLCRHSFLLAVGGGAVLDLAGLVAATAHRGIRLVRLPSTVLAQNDAGVGVKNGVNAFGRKNFLGTFAPPFAVVGDFELLETLSDRDRRAGLAEAVKVAVVKDAGFFAALEAERRPLARLESPALERAIVRCAELHLRHIREGGDPFELGSARPLDFGHWSAHRLEELTGGALRHGEAVAVGMAADARYATHLGLLAPGDRDRIVSLLADLGLPRFSPALPALDVDSALEAFRQHLGGRLSIPLPEGIGRVTDLHEIDPALMRRCIDELRERDQPPHGGPHVATDLSAHRDRGPGRVLPREPGSAA